MKTIKIKFIGFWEEFNPNDYTFFQIMQSHYRVEICEDADYVICSIWGDKYDYCHYPQVRIMFSGENYIPDFNLVDYAISHYPIDFLDRHFYLPGCIDTYHHYEKLEESTRNYTKEFLKSKQYFANFIAGHESENGIRGDFFKLLSKYKRVESIGSYLNNMPEGNTVDFKNNSKTDFQRKCKFTLCFESTKHEGFVTEKITDAFYADTIPVYFGSDTVNEIFNKKSFINCSDFNSFDEVVDKIIELDQNDDLYLRMLNEPIFAEGFSPSKIVAEEEKFICNIFDQSLESAYRRSRVYWPQRFNDFLCEARLPGNIPMKGLAKAMGDRVKNKIKH